MKSKKLRIGLIGAGGISQMVHIPGWKKLPQTEIVGIADINADLAKSVARDHKIPHAFADFHNLLRLDLDAVDICTPNKIHIPAVLAALNAGKHVICEKPLATSTAEVRKAGQLADKKKLKLMTAQNQRYTSQAGAIRSWIDDGNLGHVYHARVRAMRRAWLPCSPGFIDHRLSGGGPCMDIGVHALDLCLSFMGFPKPVRVSGTSKVNFARGNVIPGMWGEWDRKLFSVEDFAAGFVHFDNGATMTLEAAWLGHQSENEDMSCQVFGIKGGVQWPSANFATVQNRSFAQGTLSNPRNIESSHAEEIKVFTECILENKPSPVPWTQTIKVIGILEAIYESQKKGKEVAVKS